MRAEIIIKLELGYAEVGKWKGGQEEISDLGTELYVSPEHKKNSCILSLKHFECGGKGEGPLAEVESRRETESSRKDKSRTKRFFNQLF